MAYRKERGYDFFPPDRGVPYPREVNDRRPAFGRPNGEHMRNYDYDDIRYSNGGPRNYDGHRSYHGDTGPFMSDRRSGPPRREDGFQYCRMDPRDDPYGGRHGDFRDYRDVFRRKVPFPPQRERSPFRKDIPPSPHSRSGSSLSSRSYSPERSKGYSYQTQQRKRYEESYSQGRESEKDRTSSYSVSASRDGSPQSSSSASKVSTDKSNRASDPHPAEVPSEKADKPTEATDSEAQEEIREPSCSSPPQEEVCQLEAEQEAPLTSEEEAARIKSDFQERRSQAIATKAREIEKVYRQDCETFGMVVKMLVAKDPSLEKQLQNPLKENLSEIRERCLEDLKHFISELDEVVLHSESLH